MGQVGFEDHFSVFLVKTELEGSDDGPVRGTGVVEIFLLDFFTDKKPAEFDAVEGVDYFLVAFNSGGDVIFLLGFADFESGSGGGDFGS